MCMNWEEKGALGVRYLLKYIENPNSAYLDVVKDNINEIKFKVKANSNINYRFYKVNFNENYDETAFSIEENSC